MYNNNYNPIHQNLNNYLNNIYLVGGAVRDLLMKKESKDMDYVLVGYNENKNGTTWIQKSWF